MGWQGFGRNRPVAMSLTWEGVLMVQKKPDGIDCFLGPDKLGTVHNKMGGCIMSEPTLKGLVDGRCLTIVLECRDGAIEIDFDLIPNHVRGKRWL